MNLREILPEEFFKEWGKNMKEYRMLATEVIGMHIVNGFGDVSM